jgi:hypothetical protein
MTGSAMESIKEVFSTIVVDYKNNVTRRLAMVDALIVFAVATGVVQVRAFNSRSMPAFPSRDLKDKFPYSAPPPPSIPNFLYLTLLNSCSLCRSHTCCWWEHSLSTHSSLGCFAALVYSHCLYLCDYSSPLPTLNQCLQKRPSVNSL